MKHEHIAAAHLQQLPSVEVFNPQLRLVRSTRRGPRAATESLFPNYIFARFPLAAMMEKVSYTPAVKCVLRFGDRVPEIPDAVIADLRQGLAALSGQTLTDAPDEGEEVEVGSGAFAGMRATVLRVLPGKQRVRILLEVMGRAVPAELGLESVLLHRKEPAEMVLPRTQMLWREVPARLTLAAAGCRAAGI